MRKVLAIVAGLAILGAANWAIYSRETQLAQGAVVLLELAPVDPRSLMQGDYMALNFRIANDAFRRDRTKNSEDGRIVVKLDARGIASYLRHDEGEPLAADEARLRYRVRDGRVKFATNAFFFQEGTARWYERARYGEFRASPGGDLLLTHLRGEKLERLGPP
jgi:uncharacterized membrane-anchored protein